MRNTVMSNPYTPRWRAFCPTCMWQMTAYDRSRADGAAEVHGQLKPGHHAAVEPIEKQTAIELKIEANNQGGVR